MLIQLSMTNGFITSGPVSIPYMAHFWNTYCDSSQEYFIPTIWVLLQSLVLCTLGNFSCFPCLLLTFFIFFFQKDLSGTLSECQTVWIQIRTDIMSILIWVQTVCNCYQQTTKVGTSKSRVNEQTRWSVVINILSLESSAGMQVGLLLACRLVHDQPTKTGIQNM